MDYINSISLKDLYIEYIQNIDNNMRNEVHKKYPENIYRISDNYDRDSNIAISTFHFDVLLNHNSKYVYVHTNFAVVYEPNQSYDSYLLDKVDCLIKRMSKSGGWVIAAVKNATLRYLEKLKGDE